MKCSIILGATSDLAQNFIKRYFQETDKVILIAKNYKKLKKITEKHCLNAICYKADLSSSSSILSLINTIDKKKYEINLICNFVGESSYSSFHHSNINEISKSLSTNILSYVLFTNYLLNKSIKNNSKIKILNIGSLAGVSPTNEMLVYSCAKNLIHQLFDSLNFNYASKNITFHLVILGQVETKFLKKAKITKKNFDILSADKAAQYIIKKMKKNDYLIIPGFFNKIRYYMLRYLIPNLILKYIFRKNYEAFK